MSCHAVLAGVIVFVSSAFSLQAGELVLAEGGRSDYKIVVANEASPATKHGAEELQMFLTEMTGAKLPIVSDKTPQTPKEIILGENAHLKELGVRIDFASLGKEGYVIRTIGDTLVIAGGALRGSMYGVYGLLEDHLGCRWFTPEVSHIPKTTRLAIGAIDNRQVPMLEYREPFTFECFDGDWCARNRMNSSSGRLDATHGGKMTFGDGFFCHTFQQMVPPDKYFNEHPEYFSLVKGKRLKDQSQLCCTNPEVIRLCIEGVRKAMATQPGATVFSVSQNDCLNYCECENCQKLAKHEGSQMAPVLQLVNRVAEAVEKEFPDKIVETLAYQWTRHAPKQMKPRPNVVIRLCSIECCFSHPFTTCDGAENKAFRKDVEDWSKVASRLWVWDYVTDFGHYLLPFPNQRVRAPNIRFLVAHNVRGIFEQDTYETPDSELAALGNYVTAKLLWNPKYDADKATGEFLDAYYGPAAPAIRSYINLIHDYAERKNVHCGCFIPLEHPHLTDELLIQANDLWQQAESRAAVRPEVLDRVKRSRMSVDYALLERARRQAQGKLMVGKAAMDLAVARFQPFAKTFHESKINRLREGGSLDKGAYCREIAEALKISVK